LPRWPPSKMRPLPSLAANVSARAIVTGQCYVNRREIFTSGARRKKSRRRP
jgi:hypothetical protein